MTVQYKKPTTITKKFDAVDNSSPVLPHGIFVLPNDHVSYTESARHIFRQAAEDGQLFIHGGQVMELNGDRLEIVTPDKLRSRIDGYGRKVQHFVVHGKGLALKSKRCSHDIARTLMNTREIVEELPEIRIITESPVITQNGILKKGLHDNGVLVRSGSVKNVSLSDAIPALMNTLRDFDFQTPSDKSRALAMLFTPALKVGELITEPTPADLAEADQSQSGKTYRQQIIRSIYGEQAYLITKKLGGVGSLDESIGAGLISGKRFISLDNVRGMLNSEYLEAIITWREEVTVRVPHRGECSIDASMVTIQMTSNGIETTPDMANRSCIVRIRKQPDDYQWHDWVDASLDHHIVRNQSHYLGCVYAVIKEWIDKGMQQTTTTDHDMRTWARSLDWIVQNIMGQAPLLDGHRNLQKRVSQRHMNWLRSVCIAASKTEQIGVLMQAKDIAELCEEENVSMPNGKETTASDALVVGRGMAKVFRDEGADVIKVDHFTVTRTKANIYNEKRSREEEITHYMVTD